MMLFNKNIFVVSYKFSRTRKKKKKKEIFSFFSYSVQVLSLYADENLSKYKHSKHMKNMLIQS